MDALDNFFAHQPFCLNEGLILPFYFPITFGINFKKLLSIAVFVL